ncbi:uncharacterized protein LOC131298455 [Rhododendron vialii]|uniref:uncharacterized protein LOC131298455 n=1 Tax=Rhododendron vialii TaxID=182163 RepID=UPI0026602AC7|nr:uncharacterized protein LOC131298455 [Rhododendron vialii]
MGCGMSRYGMADHLDFHPIRRKLDNLRRSDRLVVTIDDTPSTKLLLRDGEDHAVSNCDNTRKSISSPHEEALKGPALEHKESLKIAEGDNTKKKNGGEEKENEVKAKNEEVVAVERDNKKDNDGEEEESDYDDEEGRLSDYDGSALWIDSPSFREYCTHDCDSDDSSKDDGNSDGEKKEIKIKEDKCNSSPNSNEGAVTKPKRKERKGRRFRKVFPMGKPSAMKNLLHVTSCYNPNAASAARDHKVGKQIEKTV